MSKILLLILGILLIEAESRRYRKRYFKRGGGSRENEESYRFMLGSNFGAWEYMNYKGEMVGFHVDLINAVCAKAGKKCNWVRDRHSNCWETDSAARSEYPGRGLMDGWYDGCVGFFNTPERANSFNFSLSWSPTPVVSLFVRRGEFKKNPSNLSDRKIGFVNGWTSSAACLERQEYFTGNAPDQYEAVYFDNLDSMVDGLLKKKIDAMFLFDTWDGSSKGIVKAGPMISCINSGLAMMAPYGNPVIGWWNEALQDMIACGEFRQLCQDGAVKHGHKGFLDCN